MNLYPKRLFAFLLIALFLLPSFSISNAQATLVRASIDDPAQMFPAITGSLIFTEQKVTSSDGAAFDNFGYTVALSGDTALVGAYNKNDSTGAAYVFVRSGAGWVQQATLAASDGRTGDRFGIAVAVSGETALVGADRDDVNPNDYQGSAYIFVRSGTDWNQQAKLTASDGAQNDNFGSVVALSGSTAFVGVPTDEVDANMTQGSVYVFARSGTTWSQQAHLVANDGAAADWFGNAVAFSGETVVIGAKGDDIGSLTNQGSAYVFTRTGTTWTQRAKLTLAEGAVMDRFGYAVALDGDTALVSSLNYDTGQDAVYVFTGSGAAWALQGQLVPAGGAGPFDDFGMSLALDGSTALVGIGPANPRPGSAIIFTRSAATWLERARLTASDGALDDKFANALALSGNCAVVGAPSAMVGANYLQGAVYFYQSRLEIYLPVVLN